MWRVLNKANHFEIYFQFFSELGTEILMSDRVLGSDSVTRVNDSTRVKTFGDSDTTRVTLRKMVTRLESHFSQNDLTRVSVIFAKSQSLWSTNPVSLHTKKWSFFGPVVIKIAANFLFWLSSRVILYPKGQVFITCTEADLRFAYHWGAEGHNIDLLTHHHDSIRYLLIVIVAVGCMLLLWVFSRWSDSSYMNTNPRKNIQLNIMHIQIPVTVISLSPCCDVITVVNVKMYTHGRL